MPRLLDRVPAIFANYVAASFTRGFQQLARILSHLGVAGLSPDFTALRAKGLLVGLVFSIVTLEQMPAQTTRVAGELTTFGTNLTDAVGTAIDGAGNVYVVTSSGAVYKETLNAVTNTYSETLILTTSSGSGSGIAIDHAGTNLLVGTGTGHSLAQYAGSGTTYTFSTNFSGFLGATAPAVDAGENVYVADVGSGVLYKETLSSGTYLQSIIATGFSRPSYITVDTSANVFVSDSGINTIYKVSGNGSTYTTSALGGVGSLSDIAGLGVDSSGNLFIQSASGVVELVLSGTTYTSTPFYSYYGLSLAVSASGTVYLTAADQNVATKLDLGRGYVDFSSTSPGTVSSKTVAFTLLSAGTLGTPTVLTQGQRGYDFTLGDGSTCTGATLTAGSSCTVNVVFNPQASGARLGAVSLTDGDGSIIATEFLGGTGLVPLALFQSTVLGQTLSTSLSEGRGLTVDPAGNVFVANSTAAQILEYPAGSGSPMTLASTGGCTPVGTTVDGAGNVFYTCNSSRNIYELVGGTGPPVPIPVGYPTDDHLGVDAGGNLYTTSFSPGNLFLKVAAGTHIVSVLATAPAGARFVAAINDAAGNIFAPDYYNNILYELPAGSSTLQTLYTGSPMQSPHAIAEDAAGNLYMANSDTGTSGQGTFNLLEFSASNYSLTPSTIAVPGADSLALDSAGNFYTIFANATLARYSRRVLTLAFASTAVGETSAAQTAVLENDGTAPLVISPPSSGTNPSLSANFNFDSSSTCEQISASSATATLPAGSSCTDVITFTPQIVGSVSGALVHTDNSLNSAGATQTVNLTGTATSGMPTVTVPNLSASAGTIITVTATVSGAGAAPTGSLAFQVGSGTTVQATCVVGTGSETCTAAVATKGLSAGPNTITANYVGDVNYSSASGTGTLALAASTFAVVTSSLNPSGFGVQVTMTAKITSEAGVPSGTTSFYDGTASLGTGALDSNGRAVLSIKTLSVGTHLVTVEFSSAGSFTGSTSAVLRQVVTKATGYGNFLSASTASGTYGQSVTFTDTLSAVGGVSATGTVTFYNGSTVLGTGTLSAAGMATLTTAALPVGSDTVTAVYAGDSNFGGSTSNAVIETVIKIPSKSSDSAKGSGVYGAPTVVIMATIPYTGNIAPTGNVTVTDAFANTVSIPVSSCTLETAMIVCRASIATANVPAGTDGLAVSQGADRNYVLSTGSGTLSMSKAPSTTRLSTSGAMATGGDMVLTAQVTSAAGIPTGTVTFLNGTTALGKTVVSTAGTATLNLSNLPTGVINASASYGGDANYLSSTSATLDASIQDFSIAATAGTPSVALASGATAAFTLALTPSAEGFSKTISLTLSGLPSGATFTFSPTTVTPGIQTVDSVLAIQIAKSTQTASALGESSGLALALLGIPFCFTRRARASQKGVHALGAILMLLVGLVGLSGCGMERVPYQGPRTYTVLVTGTSGSVTHSTTVVLNVQ